MTYAQFHWLKWLAKHGDRGRVERHQVVAADGSPTGMQPVIAFLHLVADGCLEGRDGELIITEHGRRYIERTESGELPFDREE